MNTNKKTWIFNDGSVKYHFESFPYAFRCMYNVIRKTTDKGLPTVDMIKRFTITDPNNGKVYSFEGAQKKAREMDLLNPVGVINSKEFDKRKMI
jgi:hypothetical protein